MVLGGRYLDALCLLAGEVERDGLVTRLTRALHRHANLLTTPAVGEEVYRSLVGDLLTMLLELTPALEQYRAAGDLEGLRRLHRLGLLLGRRRLVDRVEPSLPPDERLGLAARRAFLRERALPSVRMGGDADAGFWVDQEQIAEILEELDEQPGPALTRATHSMLRCGSRQTAKLYIFAHLCGDDRLLRQVEPAFNARAEHPRAELPALLKQHLAAHGGQLVRTLQRGDDQDFNPLSASLWLAELGGRQVVIKEHLRLPLDFSRVGGYSAEGELLGDLCGLPHVVRLLDVFSLFHHELLVLELAPGHPLSRHTRAAQLLEPAEALRVCAVVAGVLAQLHRRSVVYMDVKARNLVYDGGRTGALTLVDFGMARRLPDGVRFVTSLLSTPAYVPPEMGRGFCAGPPADVFQLGIMLYELLVGRHPFALPQSPRGDDLPREAQLLRFALANLHNPPRLDALRLERPALRDLLGAMLHRLPDQRPGAREVASTLEEML